MVRICTSESAIATCDTHNFKCKPNKSRPKPKPKPGPNPLFLRRFSYSDLESATSSFSPSSLLGKGSHSAVYKATLDSGALLAAVKRSTHSSSSADNEIEILSKLHGPGLVNLLGYAVDPTTHRLLLVVEHMPNGSLYELLHKSPKPPNWAGRARIALQVARAVGSLHTSNPPVIHRDIKSPNVLIDGLWRARLGDFGLALRGHVEDVRALKTPPAGTLGYLDPCYLAPGDLSAKSDVFSFGILLLEIISGRRAIDVDYSPPSVEDWALPLIKAGRYDEICDRRIGSPLDRRVVIEMAHLAVRCVRSTAEKRPDMGEAVDCLKRVYKRVRSPVWNGLKTRVGVVKSRPLMGFESFDEREFPEEMPQMQVRKSRHGTRRSSSRSRKVSDVPSVGEWVGGVARGDIPLGGRSKSFGSVVEFGFGSGVDGGVNNGLNVSKQKVGPYVGFTLGEVNLRKSRSVGVGKFKILLDGKTPVEGVFPLSVEEARKEIREKSSAKTSNL